MAAKKSAEPLTQGYLVEGGREQIASVFSFLKDHGIETDANPDVYVREYKSFRVEDARELRERAYTRSLSDAHRIFVVVAPGMTTEAQNALLKTLEEPSAGAVFFFIVPSPMTLLSTIRSRTQILDLEPSKRHPSDIDVKDFLAATPEQRIDMLKPLYEKDEDDERDIRHAMAFLAELEHALAVEALNADMERGVAALYMARKYITDKGSLMKPLLEQVALLVPRV